MGDWAQQFIGGLLALLGVFFGAIITHFLERQRRKEEVLLGARKEVYSKILVGMSSSFVPKNTDLNSFLGSPDFRLKVAWEAGELLTQGRLLASSQLSKKLREFYSHEEKIWDHLEKGKDTEKLNVERAMLTMEIENLMKKELGT